MFELVPKNGHTPRIIVFGVGGCGCNTINQLSQVSLNENVQLAAVNTDTQSLEASTCNISLQIGAEVTKGLGAGSNPQKGLEAAQESKAEIEELISTADIVFVTGGMGGGTGTGAIPFIASIAEQQNKPLLAIVTTPFRIEGEKRVSFAQDGVDKLKEHANSLIVLPNDKLIETLDKKISVKNAFIESNRVLQDVLVGLTAIITQSGFINIDLNDFIAVVSHKGRAAMGVARLEDGEELADTITKALKNPLLEDIDLTNTKGAIISVIATSEIELNRYYGIIDLVQQQLNGKALLINGLTFVDELDCELELMVIATGIEENPQPEVNLNHNIDNEDNEYFRNSKDAELLNIHDFLREKSKGTELLDVPAYTRRKLN